MSPSLPGLPASWSRVARDYRRHIAPDFLPPARRLCQALAISSNDTVLDLACGPGTAAIAALAVGAARVVGIDFARGMIQAAREEAALAARAYFGVADVLALPFADAQFDAVISSFGLIFAPDPVQASAEAARVLRSGGRIGLLAWPADGSIRAYQDAAFHYLAVAPSAHDPFEWGVPAQALGWLGRTFEGVAFEPVDVPFDADSPTEAWRLLRTATGRVAAAYADLDAPTRVRLDAEMERFFEPFRADDGHVHWPRQAVIVHGIRA
ncbi:MAG TPA: methyltransferase domain-containing protein [Gemmatimonadales bacterium]|jgi:SAM-dependent methyltransferase|nr:methyltransferase domain-containing protein [Gemmatimonadales bacterium]